MSPDPAWAAAPAAAVRAAAAASRLLSLAVELTTIARVSWALPAAQWSRVSCRGREGSVSISWYGRPTLEPFERTRAKPFYNSQSLRILASLKMHGDALRTANRRGRGAKIIEHFGGDPPRKPARRRERPLTPAYTAGGAHAAGPLSLEMRLRSGEVARCIGELRLSSGEVAMASGGFPGAPQARRPPRPKQPQMWPFKTLFGTFLRALLGALLGAFRRPFWGSWGLLVARGSRGLLGLLGRSFYAPF